MGELQKIEPEAYRVQISTGELGYEALVIATGAKCNYLRVENIENNALPMKTTAVAAEMVARSATEAGPADYLVADSWFARPGLLPTLSESLPVVRRQLI